MSSNFTANLSQQSDSYRWVILALITVSGTFVTAMPFSCMPVLFHEISEDLNLSLVQIGTIWGMASLAGIFVSILAGLISDRFNIRRVLILFCLLVGITGALRGLADSYLLLAIFVFINGAVRLILPVAATKAIGIWFKGRNLGLAMGIGAMGMGLGLMLGPLISATTLSPLLGGWRNVMFFYGGISAGIGILWLLFGKNPPEEFLPTSRSEKVPFRRTVLRLFKLKGLWLIGLSLLFRVGGMMGMTGYVPLYLENRGWTTAAAGGTLASFYGISTLCVVPLAFLSDRIGYRKPILYVSIFAAIISIGFLSIADGATVWVLMILAGIFMDGFMSIIVTLLLETEGVGTAFSGTALGAVFTITHIGSVASPPLGNSLASISSGTPFYFWAALAVIGLIPMFLIKETGWRSKNKSTTD